MEFVMMEIGDNSGRHQCTSFPKLLLIALIATALFLGASTVAAQEGEEQPAVSTEAAPSPRRASEQRFLEEVIVTARKKDESLQEVPIAINVIDAQQIAEQVITSGSDLAQASPGLSAISSVSRNNTVFSIRGQTQVFLGGQPGVLPYYAGVPDFSPIYYDLSNIQILKGPQGTLFGRNTTGGAVLLTPKKPGNEMSGYVLARVGNYSRFDKEFGFGGPIIKDLLSFRIAGQVLERDGFTEDLRNNRTLDDENKESFRLSLVVRPTEALEIYMLLQSDYIDENGTGFVLDAFRDDPLTPNRDELEEYLPIQQARGPRKVEHDQPGVYEFRKKGVISTIRWEIADELTLKYIFGYSEGGVKRDFSDGDGSPFRNAHFLLEQLESDRDRTHELQLLFEPTPVFSSVAGIYYEKTHDGAFLSSLEFTTPGAPQPFTTIFSQSYSSESVAGFIQGTYTFLEDWTITAGYRETSDKRGTRGFAGIAVADPGLIPQFLIDAGFTTNNLPAIPANPPSSDKLESSASTWNLSLNYQITPDIMTYVTLRRGYKAGGFGTASQIEGESEEEVGIHYKPEFAIVAKSV